MLTPLLAEDRSKLSVNILWNTSVSRYGKLSTSTASARGDEAPSAGHCSWVNPTGAGGE
mgnify:CR=1 FL=1